MNLFDWYPCKEVLWEGSAIVEDKFRVSAFQFWFSCCVLLWFGLIFSAVLGMLWLGFEVWWCLGFRFGCFFLCSCYLVGVLTSCFLVLCGDCHCNLGLFNHCFLLSKVITLFLFFSVWVFFSLFLLFGWPFLVCVLASCFFGLVWRLSLWSWSCFLLLKVITSFLLQGEKKKRQCIILRKCSTGTTFCCPFFPPPCSCNWLNGTIVTFESSEKPIWTLEEMTLYYPKKTNNIIYNNTKIKNKCVENNGNTLRWRHAHYGKSNSPWKV